jgi:hypothetical protein
LDKTPGNGKGEKKERRRRRATTKHHHWFSWGFRPLGKTPATGKRRRRGEEGHSRPPPVGFQGFRPLDKRPP